MDTDDKVWVNNREITPFVLIQQKQVIAEGAIFTDGTIMVYWYRLNLTERFENREAMLALDEMGDEPVLMHIGQPFRYTMMEPRS